MTSETAIANQTRRDFAFIGPLWRNNVGALLDKRGVPVRYGLANETKDENQRTKSSDLIGITPTLITQEMVGSIIGIFTALETKKSDWVFDPNPKQRDTAQLNFHNIVRGAGGFAGFVSDPNQIHAIVGRK